MGEHHWNDPEGDLKARGDWLAESYFQDVFGESFGGPWDVVRDNCGCFKATSAHDWAAGMNIIIRQLNTLNRPCTPNELRAAFNL
ncbi:hypothetical protein ACI2TD_18165 [Ralstonia nicotianae]